MYYLRNKQPGASDFRFDEAEVNDRAVFKHYERNQFCRAEFKDIKTHPTRFILYTCKSLKQILYVRELCFEHWNEWFDVYDEQGKIDLDNPPENREQTITLPCHIGDTFYVADDWSNSVWAYEVVGGSATQLFAYNAMGDLRPYDRNEIGKTIFFTKAEAEERLSSRK